MGTDIQKNVKKYEDGQGNPLFYKATEEILDKIKDTRLAVDGLNTLGGQAQIIQEQNKNLSDDVSKLKLANQQLLQDCNVAQL